MKLLEHIDVESCAGVDDYIEWKRACRRNGMVKLKLDDDAFAVFAFREALEVGCLIGEVRVRPMRMRAYRSGPSKAPQAPLTRSRRQQGRMYSRRTIVVLRRILGALARALAWCGGCGEPPSHQEAQDDDPTK